MFLGAPIIKFLKISFLESILKYGNAPYKIVLLHGGPGASGGMKPVARVLSKKFGVLELIQTKGTVNSQVEELYEQINSCTNTQVVVVGHSWGAWLGFMFASYYPELIAKLILVGAGAFETQYNVNLMQIRLERLSDSNKIEAKELLIKINSNSCDSEGLKRFGGLMAIADSYKYDSNQYDDITVDMDIFQSVWKEASELRDSNKLINSADKMRCPVVAIHGDYDSHPIEGVEKPLAERLKSFKMIKLDKCGHTPWKEKYAKNIFYKTLEEELRNIE